MAPLAAYRRYVATHVGATQLILPEGLKLLPLFALGALKVCVRVCGCAGAKRRTPA